jgi:Uncharacterised nucleotidyltransferase
MMRKMYTPSFMPSRAECREIDLVVRCMRALVSDEKDAGLREFLERARQDAVDGRFDWEKLLREAEHHSITTSVAYALLQSVADHAGADLVPQHICERLRQRLHVTAINNLRWLTEWQQVLDAFQKAGIAIISLKGPALAIQAYGNLSLREFSDLDLLVHPDDALRAQNVLALEGYRPRSLLAGNRDALLLRSGNCQEEFVNAKRGTQIDMHWGALHAMLPFQLPVNELFQSSQPAQHEGTSFLSMSREHTLLYLCAHGTKHCWARLHWLCDVALYLRSEPDLDWKQCASLAEATKCSLVVKHSLLLANNVLGLELPPELMSFAKDRDAQVLADKACSFLFSGTEHLNEVETMRYHMAFAWNWRDRVRYLGHRIFVPAEPDWNAVRIPPPLHSLYYFVRPVRIILERFSRGPTASG